MATEFVRTKWTMQKRVSRLGSTSASMNCKQLPGIILSSLQKVLEPQTNVIRICFLTFVCSANPPRVTSRPRNPLKNQLLSDVRLVGVFVGASDFVRVGIIRNGGMNWRYTVYINVQGCSFLFSRTVIPSRRHCSNMTKPKTTVHTFLGVQECMVIIAY